MEAVHFHAYCFKLPLPWKLGQGAVFRIGHCVQLWRRSIRQKQGSRTGWRWRLPANIWKIVKGNGKVILCSPGARLGSKEWWWAKEGGDLHKVKKSFLSELFQDEARCLENGWILIVKEVQLRDAFTRLLQFGNMCGWRMHLQNLSQCLIQWLLT